MFVVFVSIDKPERWSQWHSERTNSIYYSPFFDNEHETELFIDIVNKDYPKSNIATGRNGCKYHIEYIVLNVDGFDKERFKTLCNMMGAYHSYDERNE